MLLPKEITSVFFVNEVNVPKLATEDLIHKRMPPALRVGPLRFSAILNKKGVDMCLSKTFLDHERLSVITSRSNRIFGKMFIIIAIAIGLEGLVLIFKAASDDVLLLICTTIVAIASVMAIVDLGIVMWFAAKTDAVLVQSIVPNNKAKGRVSRG